MRTIFNFYYLDISHLEIKDTARHDFDTIRVCFPIFWMPREDSKISLTFTCTPEAPIDSLSLSFSSRTGSCFRAIHGYNICYGEERERGGGKGILTEGERDRE